MAENLNKSIFGKIGGIRRIQLYGNPGTSEGRSKGGRTTVEFFKKNPEIARKKEFSIRKSINFPKRTELLAEFIGIMLGDGGFRNDYQITITYNRETDFKYANFIIDLIKKLFNIKPSLRYRVSCSGADIVVTSKNLVEFLLRQGLTMGNKYNNQIDMPFWIWENKKYYKACLRGLMDTDGSIYLHKYNVSGKYYQYPKLCFTSYCYPLLCSVAEIFKLLNYKFRIRKDKKRIYIEKKI